MADDQKSCATIDSRDGLPCVCPSDWPAGHHCPVCEYARRSKLNVADEQDIDGVYETIWAMIYALNQADRADVMMSIRNAFPEEGSPPSFVDAVNSAILQRNAARCELQQIGYRLGLVGDEPASSAKIIAQLDRMGVPSTWATTP